MGMRGTQARLFLEKFDLSCMTSAYGVEVSTGEYERTTLCSDAMEYDPGLSQGGVITMNGYFTTGAVDGEEEALYNALGASDKTVALILDYQNLPAATYCLENAGNYNLVTTSPTDGLITIEGGFKSQLGVRRGLLGFYKMSVTAVGTSAAVQIPGTLTTSSGKFFVFIHSVTGTQTTPITFAVQSSANGSTGWASESAFSFAAPAPGAKVQSFTTPAGEYFSLATTSLGSATAFTVSVVFVIDGLTT